MASSFLVECAQYQCANADTPMRESRTLWRAFAIRAPQLAPCDDVSRAIIKGMQTW